MKVKHKIQARGLEKGDVLYHLSPVSKAVKILQQQKFNLTSDLGTYAERSKGLPGKSFYLSTTRSTLGEYSLKNLYNPQVHFVLDRNKIKNKFSIKSVDY